MKEEIVRYKMKLVSVKVTLTENNEYKVESEKYQFL